MEGRNASGVLRSGNRQANSVGRGDALLTTPDDSRFARLPTPNAKASGVIRGYEDLEVYQNSYKAMMMVFRSVLPILPKEERYDLADQLRRSSKAIPRLIGEGHSKRHQVKGFQKYIDDAHAESNETIISLQQVLDLYAVGEAKETCIKLIDLYDKISRQLFNLSHVWVNWSKCRR